MSKNDILKDLEYLLRKVPIIYQYMPFKGAKLLLENMTIMAKNPSEFNDPYDCDLELLNFNSATRERFKNSIENINSKHKSDNLHSKIDYENLSSEKITEMYKTNAFPKFLTSVGVSCFSESGDNLLMWSHYTRSHKGVCIGFDLEKLYFSLREKKQNELALVKVNYSKEFKTVDYFKDYDLAIYHWVKTKSKIWSYEKEVRILFTNLIFDKEKKNLIDFDKNAISKIYLGSKMERDDENWIKEFCSKNISDAELYKMTKPAESFKLFPDKIEN